MSKSVKLGNGKHSGKIPEIVELRKQGKTWGEISTIKDIPTKSLYLLRHSEGFMKVAEEIWLQIWGDIQKQREDAGAYNLGEAIKNQIRLFTLLSGTSLDGLQGPKSLDPDPEVCRKCIMQRRISKTDLMKKLQLTEKQMKVITNHLVPDTPYSRHLKDYEDEHGEEIVTTRP